MRLKGVIAAAALVVAGTVSYLYLKEVVFHPIVDLAVSDRLRVVALLPPTREEATCNRANEQFVSFFRSCPGCKVNKTRCERRLSGLERSIGEDASIPYPVVIAKDARIAVIGPLNAAMAGCNQIVADIRAKGEKSAACRSPNPAAPKP